MTYAHLLRAMAMVVLVLFIGSAQHANASQAEPADLHAFLDFGDDDGDGIPNHLDPDDNNDDVTDEDTPVPTATLPPDGGGSPVVTAPKVPVSTGTSDSGSPVTKVTSLPVTGSGFPSHPETGYLIVVAVIGVITSLAAIFGRSRQS